MFINITNSTNIKETKINAILSLFPLCFSKKKINNNCNIKMTSWLLSNQKLQHKLKQTQNTNPKIQTQKIH